MWAPLESDPDVDDRIRRIALENAHAFLIPDGLAQPVAPAVDGLHEIQAPTLVIVGEQDFAEIHAIADLMAHRIPGAQKHVIAGADRIVNMRTPEKFDRMLMDFLGLLDLG